ncbi:MAG: PAS domain S-box protein [Nitrospirae bacterium]|nr:PAS domain S-box protein [Nitrospirota bacterium]
MKFPIKYKLASIALLILVPLLVFGMYHSSVMIENGKKGIKEGNLVLAENLADELDYLIDSSFSTLQSLAKHPAVVSKDSRASDRLFKELLPSYPDHLNILAADMDGNNYGSGVYSPGVRKLNYNDKEWFINARKGMSVVGDMHISKLFKTSSAMIAVPVIDGQNSQVGVIGMPLNFAEVRKRIMKSLPRLKGASITIVDAKENVLVCSGSEQNGDPCKKISPRSLPLHDGTNGSIDERGLDGIERLYSYAGLSRTSWRVIIGVPKEVAYLKAYAFSKQYLIILFCVSAMALILSFIVSKKLTDNVSSLVSGLKEIEQGNLSATLTLTGHDELQEVAESFDSMTAKRKEADKNLRESEAFRKAVLDGIGEGVVVIGKDYRILSANQGYCDQVKMSCDTIIGKYCHAVSHHSDQPCFEKAGGCDCTVKKCFETGEHHRSMHTHFDKDGTAKYIETNAYSLKDPSGEVTAAIETLVDVTDMVTLEKRLVEVKDRYQNLYDDAPDMMHSVDREGNIIICNRTELQALGFKTEEIIGYALKDLIVPEERDTCARKMEALKTNGFFEGEITLLAKDGRRIPVFIRSKAIYDKDGAFLMSDAVLRDITEKKNLEAQLFQAQKMEAVGLLAGGVAHDFNNILTVIVGYGSLLLKKTETDSATRGYVEQVLSAAERATNLTQNLLAFSRKQIINPKPVRLSEVVKHLEKILTRVISEDIELKLFLATREASVMSDTGQLDQVLMNLATNARDAMPDGGSLIIETELVEFDNDYVRRHIFAAPGKYMLISVTDTGKGMDAKTKEKIFEPFYTTKEVGKGTGLGLSMVYGIIKQHNGYINVYSEPGKGTTFKIYLPVIEQEPEELATAVLPPVTGGTETILLAEDAVMVRDLAKNILEEFGYHVIVAENGTDAVDVYKSHHGISLLILDVIMPGKNGKEVYAEIRGLNPDIKALFMSGYTANIIHKKGILDSATEFISKPFSPNAFLRKVRDVLDQGPAA